MVKQSPKQIDKFLERLKKSFFGLGQCKNLNLTEAYRLEKKKVRLSFDGKEAQAGNLD